MLTRRQLIRAAGPAVLSSAGLSNNTVRALTSSGSPHGAENPNMRMHVGTQKSCTSEMLQFYRRCGVSHVCGTPDKWTLEGLLELKERCSRNGISLDVVPIASNLQNPSEEIFDVIRYFGTRQKIFNVHLRNISGKRDSFQEVYPDEGDLDMLKILCTLKQAHYSGMVMPDHIPWHSDDRGGRQGLAFAFGYTKGLIQAVYAEP